MQRSRLIDSIHSFIYRFVSAYLSPSNRLLLVLDRSQCSVGEGVKNLDLESEFSQRVEFLSQVSQIQTRTRS
jgi:hypothetical protein